MFELATQLNKPNRIIDKGNRDIAPSRNREMDCAMFQAFMEAVHFRSYLKNFRVNPK